jgi:hypothetical protein
VADRIFRRPKMEVATDTGQVFELLQATETDLDGFMVALVVG